MRNSQLAHSIKAHERGFRQGDLDAVSERVALGATRDKFETIRQR